MSDKMLKENGKKNKNKKIKKKGKRNEKKKPLYAQTCRQGQKQSIYDKHVAVVHARGIKEIQHIQTIAVPC